MLHVPVLFSEVTDIYRTVSPRQYVVDATQGLGGHTKMLIEQASEGAEIIGIDRDVGNLSVAKSSLMEMADLRGIQYTGVHASFSDIHIIRENQSFPHIDFILYDLGVSSVHYDHGDHGFSIRFDGPLDMRFDRSTGKSAQDFLMSTELEEMTRIFREYSDEKQAYFIAKKIIQKRREEPITTVFQLLSIIRSVSFHPKTPSRIFQALRIAVNDEFSHITHSLKQSLSFLRIGGKIAVITFHSAEDRLVKNIFTPYLKATIDPLTGQTLVPAAYQKYTKKPIVPTFTEIQKNPRSRSAKLRVIERIS